METMSAANQRPDDVITGCSLPVHGLFINYVDYPRTHFFSRPMPPPTAADGHSRIVDCKFDFVERQDPSSWYEVVDHCNGLVLILERNTNMRLHVCNPATRWSAQLPPCPGAVQYSAWASWRRRAFLVFDPFASPEYKVLLSPLQEPEAGKEEDDDDACQWPPSAWAGWHEFSSSTGRWTEKVFVREGAAAGVAADFQLNERGFFFYVETPWRYAAYWKGALYIHCHGEYVSRLSLLEDKYRVIKSPIELAECKNGDVRSFLGRSEKGVYFAAIASSPMAELRVWTLSESGGQTEWVPKDQSNLKIVNTYSWWLELDHNKINDLKYCWTLDSVSVYRMNHLDKGKKNQDVSLQQNVCWDFDDDNIVDVSDDKQDVVVPYVKFLGFHPYKEVIFFCCNGNAVALHLNTPKVQYLGTVHLEGIYNRGIRESFVYTPISLTGDYY